MSYDPRLDPEMAAALAAAPLPPTVLPGLTREGLAALRAARAAAVFPPPAEGVRVTDHRLPGPGAVRLRIHRPRAAPTGPLPCLVWMHGGGMVLGTPEMDDARLSAYVLEAGCAVVSVDYRLAPEHPYPTPVEDCYRALRWTAEQADALGVDPERLAVGGISAGGGLAAATALLARDRGGPRLAFQLLLCPMLDDRNTTTSSREFTDPVTWPRANNLYGWAALLGPLADGDEVPPYAAPARATDLSGLPPAYVDVGELEVFRDECAQYALRLIAAGVSAEFHLWPGAFHGFDGVLPHLTLPRRAAAEQIAVLRRALGNPAQGA
ncbi:alpha/beta hydrolase [Streptomyces sp. ME02-6979.5a]|uniref:alpha/beta hydrolase n=1 Tax=Streptomyces sp. ME02-6979.5a TaxID=462925 RepID=UPI0029AD1F41|nr:alpha/beta hydrolase [Streptomyces sp. ME02-6979.5a]MDX3339266.1 alpha/beta hydrolase [Streptomyces sp. ME02-6979.5a]